MAHRTVLALPEFDTCRYEDCDFLMSDGDALRTIRVSGIAPINIQFGRARWHRFTARYNCSVEQIQDRYVALTAASRLGVEGSHLGSKFLAAKRTRAAFSRLPKWGSSFRSYL